MDNETYENLKLDLTGGVLEYQNTSKRHPETNARFSYKSEVDNEDYLNDMGYL